ncbi:DUF3221 domain-containing protein [Paenibacillus sp. strain BS8-2]
MRKLIAIMIVILALGCGCSAGADHKDSDSNHSSETWDYGTGYVLEKTSGRLLIVSEPFEEGATSEEVLVGGGMKAISLKVESSAFEQANIGDYVRIMIIGAVAESYPEQGTGSIELLK